MKVCRICHEEKPHSAFNVRRDRPMDLPPLYYNECKACRNEARVRNAHNRLAGGRPMKKPPGTIELKGSAYWLTRGMQCPNGTGSAPSYLVCASAAFAGSV